jgi:hypothetical protein
VSAIISGAGGDNQDVVAEDGAVGQRDLVPGDVDAVDQGAAERDTWPELTVSRPDQAGRRGHPERHEQQARLVDVLVVGIDDHDVSVAIQQAP